VLRWHPCLHFPRQSGFAILGAELRSKNAKPEVVMCLFAQLAAQVCVFAHLSANGVVPIRTDYQVQARKLAMNGLFFPQSFAERLCRKLSLGIGAPLAILCCADRETFC
jgi:hypothetical protein